MELTFGATEAARRLGVTVKTVQRWDREGKLRPAGRSATGRRQYTQSQIDAFQRSGTAGRDTLVIADSDAHRDLAAAFCLAAGITTPRIMDPSRQNETLETIEGGNAERLVVAIDPVDHWARAEWLQRLARSKGCTPVILCATTGPTPIARLADLLPKLEQRPDCPRDIITQLRSLLAD